MQEQKEHKDQRCNEMGELEPLVAHGAANLSAEILCPSISLTSLPQWTNRCECKKGLSNQRNHSHLVEDESVPAHDHYPGLDVVYDKRKSVDQGCHEESIRDPPVIHLQLLMANTSGSSNEVALPGSGKDNRQTPQRKPSGSGRNWR